MRQSEFKVFVIMPISGTTKKHTKEYWNEFYRDLQSIVQDDLCEELKQAFSVEAIRVWRAESPQGPMMDSIVEDILASDIVLAVLTDLNPNVFYELAIRHSLTKKNTVMLYQQGTCLPFDLKPYGAGDYEDSPERKERVKEQLSRRLAEIREKHERPDNPMDQFRRNNQKWIIEPRFELSSADVRHKLRACLAAYSSITVELGEGEEIDESVVSVIALAKPLRDDLVSFVREACNEGVKEVGAEFGDFLERISSKLVPWRREQPWNSFEADAHRFLIYELILYVTAICLEAEQYDSLAAFVHRTYFHTQPASSKNVAWTIADFNRYVESLNQVRNKRKKLGRLDLTGDLIWNRFDGRLVSGESIFLADTLLFYLTVLRNYRNEIKNRWMPHTTVKPMGPIEFPLFSRLVSKTHFLKVRRLLSLQLEVDFDMWAKDLSRAIKNDLIGAGGTEYNILTPNSLCDYTKNFSMP